MPAPDRPGDRQTISKVLDVPKGIIGHYTDLEIDALLAGLSGGTLQTVDLSAYATTAYVDGELAKVYDKAEVDALLATIVSGGTIDLSGYATTEQLDSTKTEILTAATTAFQERYTKQEVDGLFVKQADLVAPPNLDGYATEQYVDESIARIPATDLSEYATQQELADALAGLNTQQGEQIVIKHDEELPRFGAGVTPLQVLAAWASYEPGVHLFAGENLVLLAKKSLTSTTATADGEKPTASENLTATVFVNGTGATYLKVTTTAIDGVQSNAPSEIIASMGGQWVKMNSTRGDVAFAPAGMADIFGGVAAPDLMGLATEKYVADSIAASFAAVGIGTGGEVVAPSNPAGGTRESITEEQVRTIVSESAMTEDEVARIARTVMSGGKEPPPDRPWGATVVANLSLGAVGLVEARLRNGQITLRGELAYTTSATGSFANVRSLPLGFPRPDVDYSGVVIGKENGVTFRAVAYKIQTDGMISVCPIGGKITHVTFDGATAYV